MSSRALLFLGEIMATRMIRNCGVNRIWIDQDWQIYTDADAQKHASDNAIPCVLTQQDCYMPQSLFDKTGRLENVPQWLRSHLDDDYEVFVTVD